MYPIPANATRIRYLESTGTQYVDTGYPVTTLDVVDIDFQFTDTSTYQQRIYEQRNGTSGFEFGLYISGSGNFGFMWQRQEDAAVFKGTSVSPTTSRLHYVVDGPQLIYRVGQTTISSGAATAITDANGTMFIGSANASRRAYARVFGLTITHNGILVRSYVPVRVGSTGYLFDRVSGQLFGNAGTGDFVLGPDTFQQGVVPTKMMAMGVRKKDGPSSLDYVQDGLYYQLDGIENAGRGVHDASATVWTDLTGNGRDATFINGKTWLDDAVYLYGKTSDHMAKIRGLPSMTAFTFEIVSRIDSQESYARLFDTEAYGTAGKRFAGLSGTGAYPNSMSFVCGADSDLNYSDFPLSTAARAISLTPTKNGSNIIGLNGYLNGTYKQTLYPGQYISQSTSTYIDVANRSNSPNRGFDGAVFAIRVYNRVLTADEIAANYAIDKARFNLP